MNTKRFNWSGSLFKIGLALLAIASTAATKPPSAVTIQFYAGVTITNPVGSVCSVEWNTDLAQANNWSALTNLTLPCSPYLYVDTTAPASAPRRFYRVTVSNPDDVTNPDPANLVSISPGTFTMGEAPNTVQVTLTHAYFIAKNLVTQGGYMELMDLNPSENTGDSKYPVEMVSWFKAQTFCAQLTAREQAAGRLPAGWSYRLPTEAEWEYACRAGTTTRFSFGDDPDGTLIGSYAWYSGNVYGATHEVGSKLPNPWGLFDMHGNVHEWCSDFFGDLQGGTDPTGPSIGSTHVWRGGSFNSGADSCTSTYRNSDSATCQENNIGFRVVAAPILP